MKATTPLELLMHTALLRMASYKGPEYMVNNYELTDCYQQLIAEAQTALKAAEELQDEPQP